MDSAKSECYEFLDLSDVDDNERSQLKESLFGNSQSDHLLQLPWAPVDQSMPQNNTFQNPVAYQPQWQPHPQQYDGYHFMNEEICMTESPIPGESDQTACRSGSPASCVTSGSSGVMSPHSGVGNGPPPPSHMYGPPPPNIYTVPQPGPAYTQHPQNVFVSNVTANVNLHGYVGPYISHQGYSVQSPQMPPENENVRNTGGNRGRNRGRNLSRHRQNEIDPSTVNSPYLQYVIPPYPATYYTQPPPGLHPAAGSPLYITPFYQPPPMYGPYSAASNTLVYPGMQVSADYQYPNEAAPHNVQEVHMDYPDSNQGIYEPTATNDNIPQMHPQQDMVTTVIVNNKVEGQQSNSKTQSVSNKTPYMNAHVQIKQNLRNEPYDANKPQVMVVTPSNEITKPNVVNIKTNGQRSEPIKVLQKNVTEKHSKQKHNLVTVNPVSNTTNTVKEPLVKNHLNEVPQKNENATKATVKTTSNGNENIKEVSEIHAVNPNNALSVNVKVESNNTKEKLSPSSVNEELKAAIPEIKIKTTPNVTSNKNPTNVSNITTANIPTTSSSQVQQVTDKEISTVLKKVLKIEEAPVTNGPSQEIDKTVPNHTVEPSKEVVVNHVEQTKPSEEIANKIEENQAAVNTPTKSWASLFTKTDKNSGDQNSVPKLGNKPLARVQPLSQDKQPAKPVVSESPLSQTKSKKNKEVISTFLEDPNAYRMGEFLSSYAIDNRTISFLPRGFTNKGNYCYVNSILQALIACPPFYNLMRALPQQYANKFDRSSSPVVNSMIDLVNKFSPLSPGMKVAGRREKAAPNSNPNKAETLEIINYDTPLEPSCVYKSLHSVKSETFSVDGRQEDAEEFLGCLLNGLNDEMVDLIKLVSDKTPEPSVVNGDAASMNGDAQDQDEETEWKVMGPKNKGSITRKTEFDRSPISDIFRGQLRSRVQRAGDQSTDNVQPFFTLQLDIEKAGSVKDALELLAGRDKLEGVTCSKTQKTVEAWQQVSLEELPLVLLLHLKCFNYKRDGCSKIIKTVDFPIDLKIDSKLMSATKKYNNKQKQYKLFAVVYHEGTEATKGHYITDAYHSGYGGWLRYDDSTFRGVPEAQVLRPRTPRMPYLLYYRRCDTIGNQGGQPQNKKE